MAKYIELDNNCPCIKLDANKWTNAELVKYAETVSSVLEHAYTVTNLAQRSEEHKATDAELFGEIAYRLNLLTKQDPDGTF